MLFQNYIKKIVSKVSSVLRYHKVTSIYIVLIIFSIVMYILSFDLIKYFMYNRKTTGYLSNRICNTVIYNESILEQISRTIKNFFHALDSEPLESNVFLNQCIVYYHYFVKNNKYNMIRKENHNNTQNKIPVFYQLKDPNRNVHNMNEYILYQITFLLIITLIVLYSLSRL